MHGDRRPRAAIVDFPAGGMQIYANRAMRRTLVYKQIAQVPQGNPS
jgi:hypothetical protein